MARKEFHKNMAQGLVDLSLFENVRKRGSISASLMKKPKIHEAIDMFNCRHRK